jgi:phosphoglycerate dehydrogenase-like enzyme
MTGPPPTMTVMAARGRDSFSDAQRQALERAAALTVHAVPARLAADAFLAAAADAEILGFTRRAIADLDADLIARLPRLRAVAVHATGQEWIDVDALRARGIAFAALPGYSTDTVAEHAMALLLTLSRRVHLSDRVARGDLPTTMSLRGWELRGKRLGVIGHGRIGARIAQLAQAFGMNVAYCDPAPAVDPGALPRLAFADLLAQSHVVVLACPRQRGASAPIDADALARMPRGAWLVNPARSTLVDPAALLDAVRDRRLAGYAVDDRVFTAQDLVGIESGRILQTGHTAWYSDEAVARGMQAWTDALVALARGLRDA